FSGVDKMWWIENHQIEGIIIKWHIPKINNYIRVNDKCSPVTEGSLRFSIVSENNIRIVSIKPEHTTSAACIQNFRHCHSSLSFAISTSAITATPAAAPAI